MKLTFKQIKILILLLLISYVFLIIGYFTYKQLCGSETVYFKIKKIKKLDDFFVDLFNEDHFCYYDAELELLKSTSNKIDKIYVSCNDKPESLLCGYVTYVRPTKFTDLLMVFFGNGIYETHNVELVNNLSEQEINKMFDQKSKGFLGNNIYLFLIYLVLIILGYFINKKTKPIFIKQNEELIFNRPKWLEWANTIILITLIVFSPYLSYDSLKTGNPLLFFVFAVLFVLLFFRLYYELKNINDYLTISKNYLRIKDNKRIEKILYSEIISVSILEDGLKIKTENKEINFGYTSMNLHHYANQINQNIKLVLGDKVIVEENKK
jgi:hypothetical protein